MSTLEISRVDVHDDAALAAWHGVAARAELHDRGPHATIWTLPELTAQLRVARRARSSAAYVGTVGGEAVAFGMLEHLLAEVGVQGRTTIQVQVNRPWGLPQELCPGAGFARRHGFREAMVEVMRRLDLPVEEAVLARLDPGLEGYTVRSWVGRVPDDLVEQWAVLDSSLTLEAPTGDLHVEAQVADVGAVRDGEELFAAQGRTPYRAVVLAPDGTVVGYTEVVTTVHEPGRAYQWGTLVHRDHRGHRLGTALKVAALRRLQEEVSPAGPVDHVITWNAQSNTHMVAVNEQLGFVPVEWAAVHERRP